MAEPYRLVELNEGKRREQGTERGMAREPLPTADSEQGDLRAAAQPLADDRGVASSTRPPCAQCTHGVSNWVYNNQLKAWIAALGFIAFAAFIAVYAAVVSVANDDNSTAPPNAAAKLDTLFARHWVDEVQDSPELATYYGLDASYLDGIKGNPHAQLSDLSQDAFLATQRRRESTHARLTHLLSELPLYTTAEEVAMTEPERQRLISARSLRFRLELDTALYWHSEYLAPITQQTGVQLDLPQLVSMSSFEKESDYNAYLARLEEVPRYMDQTIALMKEGVSRGITPPQVVLGPVQAQIATLAVNASDAAAVRQSPFYKPFASIPDTVPAGAASTLEQRGFDSVRNKAIPAFTKLLAFWTGEYYPHCRQTIAATALPNGTAYYDLKILEQTTLHTTAAKLHATGESETQRIHAAMVETMHGVNATATFPEFVHFLKTSPQFFFDTADALVAHNRDVCKRADPQLPLLFGKLPRCPYGVTPVPAAQAPAAPAAYYYEPADGCSRAGYYYVNVYDLPSRPSYLMESTTLHETVPGHHLQIALAQEMEGVPTFRKFSGWTAYIEGWALYSESLGPRMGFYTDPYVRFGAYGDEILRACRLVVDTGMHALNWTRQEAVDFMTANTPLSDGDIASEVDRYIADPGQALAYKTGELRIQALRNQTQAALGEAFDIRSFHDAVIGTGAVPLDELTHQIDLLIESSQDSR